jgi:hypothetical protein
MFPSRRYARTANTELACVAEDDVAVVRRSNRAFAWGPFNVRDMLSASDPIQLLFLQFEVTALGSLGQVVCGRDFRILLARLHLVSVAAHGVAPLGHSSVASKFPV